MSAIGRHAGLALAAWSLASAAPAGSADDAASYAVRVPVTAAVGSPVQRLVVPAQALAAAQTTDLSDLRIFDATGRAMPMARIASARATVRRDLLPALPIMGAADALDVTGVALKIGDDGQARVAQVTGTIPDRRATPIVLGVLLDARAIAGEARSLAVEAEVPASQPVTFTVEASDNLKDWRLVGEKVAYSIISSRRGDTIPVPLGGTVLHGDYLRVTWRGASRLLSPVLVHRALLLTGTAAGSGGSSIKASAPPLTDAHAIEFGLPFAAAIRAIRVAPTGSDIIVPIRLFSRDNREQPWVALGESTAARPVNDLAAAQDAIGLGGGAHRDVRIEATERSGGFTSAPEITFDFARREIAFLATGKPPFVLAAGKTAATDTYLPLVSMLTQAPNGQLATATTPTTRATIRLAPLGSANPTRKILLWAVLLIATALLGGMALSLWRKMPSG